MIIVMNYVDQCQFTLTVITPSLIVFLFRITIPIGFRNNFFGIIAVLTTHTRTLERARQRRRQRLKNQ